MPIDYSCPVTHIDPETGEGVRLIDNSPEAVAGRAELAQKRKARLHRLHEENVAQAESPQPTGPDYEIDNLQEERLGTPPHPRGTRRRPAEHCFGRRYTPAPAGNTNATAMRPITRPVHPRTRGEHNRITRLSSPRCGTPPHPRGTL